MSLPVSDSIPPGQHLPQTVPPFPGQHLPQSTSGWYASYWNAFLSLRQIFSGLPVGLSWILPTLHLRTDLHVNVKCCILLKHLTHKYVPLIIPYSWSARDLH